MKPVEPSNVYVCIRHFFFTSKINALIYMREGFMGVLERNIQNAMCWHMEFCRHVYYDCHSLESLFLVKSHATVGSLNNL